MSTAEPDNLRHLPTRSKPRTHAQAADHALLEATDVENLLRGHDLPDDLIGAPLAERVAAALAAARHDGAREGAQQTRDQLDVAAVARAYYGGHDAFTASAARKLRGRLVAEAGWE